MKDNVGVKIELSKNTLKILKNNYFVLHCIFSPSVRKNTIVEKYEIKFKDNNVLQIDKPYDDKINKTFINYRITEGEKIFLYFDIDLPVKKCNYLLLSCDIISNKISYCLTGKNYMDLDTMLYFNIV